MKRTLLAKNFKKLRLFKGLNQNDFAALFDLTRSSIGAYEEGRAEPKLETLIKISSHFKLPLDELVKNELTVNKIAGFKLPKIDESEIQELHTKIDELTKKIDDLSQKLNR
ncbi:helix-turn-helix domain-containing protein [Crocinitomix algicola]|uniref:helix-turn-helix domain-containing protein n=1 Tax=Crocinitomix algicola TaxID=1740263 RepID=UPI000834C945|nr:helix-turn-helix transcriptional regulator [Crocinitomix algicola]